MAKPEKRWQLLLVADDGRIIPFKRIKGIAVTLVILLVLLGLVCAGLAWQLTAEKVRHRKTLNQFADAKRQVTLYKSEHELITAELVLAEARMEKAGLLIPKRQERIPQQKPMKTADAESVSDTKIDDGEKGPEPSATADTTASPTAAKQPSVAPAATPAANVARKAAPEATLAEVSAEPEKPAIALGNLEMKHDSGKKVLLARFRVKNNGLRSSPVAGRCVVVLKNDWMDPKVWLAMPGVTLVDGKPDGERGQAFRISRFRDMEIKAMGQTDPSSFKTATVYVFDTSGAQILAKDFPIDLPAPKPEPKPVPPPAAEPVTTDVPAVPMESPPINIPVNQQTPFKGPGEAAENLPMATSPPDADTGAASQPVPTQAPIDDPSLIESVEPVKEEDARDRF
ncbi:MAG: hypothetical protein HGJ94_15215 [Desulfosarcina sp.]|nr:hypothetical protein [Desulfosarcina sp.]MBC2744005.1 hypothetical protein [Desulfosarcina sp.]MBC2766915.1 hypothetical protein [Desulfosarcina sp.]